MTLCLRGFSFCNCLECKLIKSLKQTEKNLSELNIIFNELTMIKNNRIEHLTKKHNLTLGYLSFNKDNSIINNDHIIKSTRIKLNEIDKKIQRLIYRLNSLENKADLFDINLNELIEGDLIC